MVFLLWSWTRVFCSTSLYVFIAVRSRTGKIDEVGFLVTAFREINTRAICFQCWFCFCDCVTKSITGPLHFTNFSNRAERIGPAYSVYELISCSSLLSQHSSFLNNVAGNVYMPAVWKHQYRIFAVDSKWSFTCHQKFSGSGGKKVIISEKVVIISFMT